MPEGVGYDLGDKHSYDLRPPERRREEAQREEAQEALRALRSSSGGVTSSEDKKGEALEALKRLRPDLSEFQQRIQDEKSAENIRSRFRPAPAGDVFKRIEDMTETGEAPFQTPEGHTGWGPLFREGIDFQRTEWNIPTNFGNLVAGFSHMGRHPLDTGKMVMQTMSGMPIDVLLKLQELKYGDGYAGGLRTWLEDDPAASWLGTGIARGVRESFTRRIMNPKETIEEDLLGFGWDLLDLWTGGQAFLARRAAKTVGEMRMKSEMRTNPLGLGQFKDKFYGASGWASKQAGEVTTGMLGIMTGGGDEIPRYILDMAEKNVLTAETIFQNGGNIMDVLRLQKYNGPDIAEFKAARSGQRSLHHTVEQLIEMMDNFKKDEVKRYRLDMKGTGGTRPGGGFKKTDPMRIVDVKEGVPGTMLDRLDDVKAGILKDLEDFGIFPEGRGELLKAIELSRANRRKKLVLTDSNIPGNVLEISPENAQRIKDANIQPGTLGLHIKDKVLLELFQFKPSGTRYLSEPVGTMRITERQAPAVSTKMDAMLIVGEAKDRKGRPVIAEGDITNKGERETMRKAIDLVLSQEHGSLLQMDQLKKSLDSIIDKSMMAQPSSPSNAFVVKLRTRVYNSIKDIKNSEGVSYEQIAKRYEAMSEMRRQVAVLFGLDAKNPETSMGRILSAMDGKHRMELRQAFAEKFKLNSGPGSKEALLASRIAGFRSKDMFGSGLVSRSSVMDVAKGLVTVGTVGVALGDPSLMVLGAIGGVAGLAMTSPKMVSSILLTAGTGKAYAKNVTTICAKIAKEAKLSGMVVAGLTWGDVVNRLNMSEADRKVREREDEIAFQLEIEMNLKGIPFSALEKMKTKDLLAMGTPWGPKFAPRPSIAAPGPMLSAPHAGSPPPPPPSPDTITRTRDPASFIPVMQSMFD